MQKIRSRRRAGRSADAIAEAISHRRAQAVQHEVPDFIRRQY